MNFDVHSLGLELAVLALFGIVFVADLLLGREEKRGLGSLTGLGLVSILIGSFFFDYDGTALFDTYVSDGPGLFFKRVLLLVGAIGADTLRAMAEAGPAMQAKLLSGLGIQSTLITDGKSPINLLGTAQGMIAGGAVAPAPAAGT